MAVALQHFRRIREAAASGEGLSLSAEEVRQLAAAWDSHLSGADPAALFGAPTWEINERANIRDAALCRLSTNASQAVTVNAAAVGIERQLTRYVSTGGFDRAISGSSLRSDPLLDLLVGAKGRVPTVRTLNDWIPAALARRRV